MWVSLRNNGFDVNEVARRARTRSARLNSPLRGAEPDHTRTRVGVIPSGRPITTRNAWHVLMTHRETACSTEIVGNNAASAQ